MGLSHRVTEILERWLGEGECLPQTAPMISTRVEHEIHEGNFYSIGHLFEDVIVDGSVYLNIVNQALHELHVIINIVSSNKIIANIYEGNSFSSQGVEITAYNHNRNNINVSSASFYYSPTVNALGELIYPETIKSEGCCKEKIGSNGNELIISPSTNVLIKVDNKGTSTTDINIIIEEYEKLVNEIVTELLFDENDEALLDEEGLQLEATVITPIGGI